MGLMRQIACQFHSTLTAFSLAICLGMASASCGLANGSGTAAGAAPLWPAQSGGQPADAPEGALPFADLPPPIDGLPEGGTPALPDQGVPDQDPQDLPEAGDAAGTNDVAADPAAAAPSAEDIDQLFAELAAPEGDAWIRAQSDIQRIWSRSGSAAMDLLYKRGEEALDAGDLAASIGHLTALTDHAPDFAGGWYLRAVAYYLDGEFGPAVADLGMALQLEPRHFFALTQLGGMLEETGDDKRALDAYRASLKINPHQQEAVDAVTRLEQKAAGTDA